MKALLEIHLLQNFAPSNLNRDDTGSPKDAYFGGTRRGRISSQSLKRAIRTYFKEQHLLSKDYLAIRTKRFLSELVKRLVELEKLPGESELAVRNAITAMGTQKNFKFDAKRPELTEYLFSLGDKEIQKLLETITQNWGLLTTDKPVISKELKRELENTLDGGQAVDIALFGRMLANLPEKNQYAACQVAHAISTHKVEHNEDFYTAVDDLKPEDNAGADMLGTVEFNSACYYRYAVIDLTKLRSNLQGDDELLLKGVEAFLRSSIFALPTGKQNSFAAHQLPSFIGFTVRREASPRSLANAFETPVRTPQDGWLNASASALIREWNDLEGVFGQGGYTQVVNRTEAQLNGVLRGTRVDNVDTLVSQTLEQVRATLTV